jgi:DNA-binding TFAR19-related protein (PDSD5 family)
MNEDFKSQIEHQMKLKQQVSQLEASAKLYLTPEAITRYGNIKSAHPEKALQVLLIIAQAVQSGLNERISDDQLKLMLQQMSKPQKEFKFMRK